MEKKNCVLTKIELGKDAFGKKVVCNIAEKSPVFVTGQTGSGKSFLLHQVISQALADKNLNLVLIDTKQCEFDKYKKEQNVKVLHSEKDIQKELKNLLKEHKGYTLIVFDELAETSAAILELLKELINQEGFSVLLSSQKGLPRVLCRKVQTRINTFRDFHIEVCEK